MEWFNIRKELTFYVSDEVCRVIVLVTGAFCVIGWFADLLRIPQLVRKTNAKSMGLRVPSFDLVDTYLLWFSPFGLLGFHQIYLKRINWGFFYFFTCGVLGTGWIIDLFRIPSLVNKANQLHDERLTTLSPNVPNYNTHIARGSDRNTRRATGYGGINNVQTTSQQQNVHLSESSARFYPNKSHNRQNGGRFETKNPNFQPNSNVATGYGGINNPGYVPKPSQPQNVHLSESSAWLFAESSQNIQNRGRFGTKNPNSNDVTAASSSFAPTDVNDGENPPPYKE